MKPILPIFAAAAVLAAGISFFTQPTQAQKPAGSPASKAVTYPVGSRCVITLDPSYPSSTKRSGGAGSDVFEVTDNKVQGDLVIVDDQWIILKEGNYENWVPRDKVLSIRVSR